MEYVTETIVEPIYQKNWLDKLITHSQDKKGDFGSRVAQHIFIGFLIGATFPLSYPLLKIFIKYEESEDKWVQDQAWKDYFGCMVGLVLGLLTELAAIGYLIWWLLQ